MTWLRRTSALLAAATLLLTVARPAEAAPSQLPDGSRAAALTITRVEVVEGAAAVVPGSRFRVTLLERDGAGAPLDLTTATGWDRAAGVIDAGSPGGSALGASREATTGADGVARFAGLPIGLYWVEELAVPANLPFVVELCDPFFVLLPEPDPEGSGALYYVVDARPKSDPFTVSAVSEPLDPPAPDPTPTPDPTASHVPGGGPLPRTGGGLELVPAAAAALVVGCVLVAAARRRRAGV